MRTEDPWVVVFEEQRPRLFGIAYRLLGSAHDAEDAVQDSCYSHREVAAAVELSEAHSRQLHSRARRHLAAHARPASAPGPVRWTELVVRFLGAARSGDLPALEALLAADVTVWSDGGGKVHAARRPVHGRTAVARYLAGVTAARYTDGLKIAVDEVNGEPAVLVWSGEQLGGVLTVEVDAAGAVRALRFLVNPDKLEFLARRHAALSRLSRSGPLPGHPDERVARATRRRGRSWR